MDENIKKIAFVKGLLHIKDKQLTLLNITLKPTLLDREDEKIFNEIVRAQLIMNRLCFSAMHKANFHITNPIFVDVLSKIKKIKPIKKVYALFARADYLLTKDKGKVRAKQIELNTISCAFVVQGPVLNRIHRLSNCNAVVSDSDAQFINFLKSIRSTYVKFNLKDESVGKIDNMCVLMVDNNTSLEASNIFEKLQIIYLAKKSGIDVFHCTYDDIRQSCTYKDPIGNEISDTAVYDALDNGEVLDADYDMYYHGRRVFCVYYRWFYNRDQYSEKDILTRAKIECSSAVSVPCIDGQIVGLKAVSLDFRNQDFLRKFLTKSDTAKIVDLFGDYREFKREELKNIHLENFVLKTLDEGGGSNYFGNEIKNYDGPEDEVFLMEKVRSKQYPNKFSSNETKYDIHPEIGIMGWVVGTRETALTNKNAGYICRSKRIDSNECGVTCGYGALDTLEFPKDEN